ncbi:MAG: adenylate/guanylate cyclase domain-containing protein, partial [Nitrospiraceae bacterium]
TVIASLLVILGNGLFWGSVGLQSGAIEMMLIDFVFAGLAIPPLLLSKKSDLKPLIHITLIIAISFVWTFIVLVEGIPGAMFPNFNHWYFLGIGTGALLLFCDSTTPRVAYTSFALVSFLICDLQLVEFGPAYPLPGDSLAVSPLAQSSGHISVFIVVILLSNVFVSSMKAAEKQLAEANATLESLLENMLPKAIAERLRKEGKTFADGYSKCSVLFADLVGFTRLSTEIKPEELVKLLDEIFSRFDELTAKYGLEKIKTIGDAYMVAGGLPEEREDHAQACVALATDMRSIIREYAGLKVRIGINSGEVVAGIIGKRKFIYDLWGDTVNIASRMESQGLEDEIQVSERTAELIASDYETTPRGQIDIKGKGPMAVFLVNGKRIRKVVGPTLRRTTPL